MNLILQDKIQSHKMMQYNYLEEKNLIYHLLKRGNLVVLNKILKDMINSTKCRVHFKCSKTFKKT